MRVAPDARACAKLARQAVQNLLPARGRQPDRVADLSLVATTNLTLNAVARALAPAESLRNCDPSGIRTLPGRFDDNRGTTRTCIDCRGVSGGSDLWGRTACARRIPRREAEFQGVVATTWQQN